MTLNPDLIKAILSMDAYNRGYDPGINTLPSEFGDRIGNATITLDSRVFQDGTGRIDAAIGFYALAYDVDLDGDGTVDETVISYRGTDDFDGVTVAEYGGLS